ncbi:MAG: hypothetical protein KTR20_01675 [Cellvibrionaceae bacterium]|nr:hypothetical protein [Cellvibrionaceae bacterium]
MKYSYEMAALVISIRRRAPAEIKPLLKFSNERLLDDIRGVYAQTEDDELKALMSKLLSLVDGARGRTQSPVYGGQPAEQSPDAASNAKKRRQKIYRGRVIDDD